MSFAVALGVIGVVQGVFLVLLLLFLVVRRAYDRRQRAAFLAGRGGITVPLRAWLVAGAHPEPVVRAIRALPRGTAIGYVSLLARQTIPEAQREELADALRGEAWIAAAIGQRRSRFWWRRLEAARALSLVGEARDRAAVDALISDPHPAVQVAAISALPRVADAAVLGSVLDRLFRFPKVVRQYLTAVLRQTRHVVGPALALRIGQGTELAELGSWIELAEAIDDHDAIAAAMLRADHPAEGVRRAVARALRRRPGPDALHVLNGLLADRAPSVRAAAARTLGELGATASAPLIAPSLSDPVWVVRLRAAIALAQLGERGRATLRAAREGDDRFARDMASMVNGLSDGALLELGDA